MICGSRARPSCCSSGASTGGGSAASVQQPCFCLHTHNWNQDYLTSGISARGLSPGQACRQRHCRTNVCPSTGQALSWEGRGDLQGMPRRRRPGCWRAAHPPPAHGDPAPPPPRPRPGKRPTTPPRWPVERPAARPPRLHKTTFGQGWSWLVLLRVHACRTDIRMMVNKKIRHYRLCHNMAHADSIGIGSIHSLVLIGYWKWSGGSRNVFLLQSCLACQQRRSAQPPEQSAVPVASQGRRAGDGGLLQGRAGRRGRLLLTRSCIALPVQPTHPRLDFLPLLRAADVGVIQIHACLALLLLSS